MGECTVPARFIERTGLHLVQTSSAATANPSSTWTQAAGVTAYQRIGSRFSAAGTHAVTDERGGQVRAICRITYTCNEDEEVEFGLGVDAGTPANPRPAKAPASGEPGHCTVMFWGELAQGEALNLMLRCPGSATADITVTHCQWDVEELPASEMTLLALVTAAGGLLFDFRTSAGYTLGSGSDIDAIRELVNGVDIVDDGTPAALEATGLDGGPCINFGGSSSYTTTNAALLGIADDDASYTVIARMSWSVVDTTITVLGWYDSGGPAESRVAQSTTGAGRLQMLTRNDANTSSNTVGGDDVDTSAHTNRWQKSTPSSKQIDFFRDSSADSFNPQTRAATGTTTLNTFRFGGIESGANLNARVSVAVILPGEPDSGLIAQIEALLAP